MWRKYSSAIRGSAAQIKPPSASASTAALLRRREARPRSSTSDSTDEVASLNADLDMVVALFPDVRPEVFRELLLSFSEESRLYLTAEALLMNKAKVVRGRWRVDGREDAESRSTQQLLPRSERFRSEAYKGAVKAALCDEFRSLSRSTIDGILAEHNHSYINARPELLQLSTSSSWSSLLPSWLSRRRSPSVSNHPLIFWDKTPNKRTARVKASLNPELELELMEALVLPAHLVWEREQVASDAREAAAVNDAEAEAANATFDCECCFNASSWERTTACTDSGHFVCYTCLQRTLSEAIYGQGWAQSIDVEKATLRCVALCSESCTGIVPQDQLRLAIHADERGQATWMRFEDRLVRENLTRSELEVLQCPSCHYAEAIPPATGPTMAALLRPAAALVLTFAAFTAVMLTAWMAFCASLTSPKLLELMLNPVTIVIAVVSWRVLQPFITATTLKTQSRALWLHIAKTVDTCISRCGIPAAGTASPLNYGRKFVCRAVHCGQTSCLTCHATPWTDPHACHDARATSLRTHVEAALSAAAKRTCPGCGLSFVKAAGCNKLVCQCGYAMCYTCRADVRRAGYQHFCPHFRPAGAGDCPVACGRCDLYRDEDLSLDEVRRAAEEEWWSRQDRRSGFEGEREVLESALEGLGDDKGLSSLHSKGKRRWNAF